MDPSSKYAAYYTVNILQKGIMFTVLNLSLQMNFLLREWDFQKILSEKYQYTNNSF